MVTLAAATYRERSRHHSFAATFTPLAAVLVLAWSILGIAAVGEADAIRALLYHQSSPTQRIIMVTAISVLTTAVAFVPGAQIARALGFIGPAPSQPSDSQPKDQSETDKPDPAQDQK